jgi:hypothetical protein
VFGSYFPRTRARRLGEGKRDGECAKCEGQRSSSQETRTTGTRDMTVYIDSTGTTDNEVVT